MGAFKDLTGQRFGKLTIIKKSERRGKDGSVYWECLCDCGNISFASTGNLKRGNIKSCGCGQISARIESLPKAFERFKEFNIEETNILNLKMKKPRHNKSGFKGVCRDNSRNKWMSYIEINKKRIYLGFFDEIEDAILARKKAEEIYFKPIIDKFNELHQN